MKQRSADVWTISEADLGAMMKAHPYLDSAGQSIPAADYGIRHVPKLLVQLIAYSGSQAVARTGDMTCDRVRSPSPRFKFDHELMRSELIQGLALSFKCIASYSYVLKWRTLLATK
jgi:hypothetical protein